MAGGDQGPVREDRPAGEQLGHLQVAHRGDRLLYRGDDPRHRGLADPEHRRGHLLALIVPVVEQRRHDRLEQPYRPPPTAHRLPAVEIVLATVCQLKDLLDAEPGHSLQPRRPPHYLVDLHKSRRYPTAAVAFGSDTPTEHHVTHNFGSINARLPATPSRPSRRHPLTWRSE